MTNVERQKSLDRKKWLESEKGGADMSGSMLYCVYCNRFNIDHCEASQSEKEANCLCARAYNRMIRKG